MATPSRSKNDESLAACVEAQRRLAEHMAILRAEFQEALACYSVKVQGVLTEVGDTLRSSDPRELNPIERAARVLALQRALEQVERLDLRPSKGRRRDLKAIENAATYLGEVVGDW